MDIIEIDYSGDFREDKTPNQVYSRLRESGIGPSFVNIFYNPKKGSGKVIYSFGRKNNLPEKSKLIKLLEGIKFNNLSVRKLQ